MNKEKLLKELERLTPSITMEMLESILDNFFNVETRKPITSETLTAIKRKTGVQLSVKNIQRQIDALVVLGCKLAPTAYERTTKKWMIAEVCSKGASSIELVTKVYENLIFRYRKSHYQVAARLQDSDGLGPHYATIKRIEDKFIELGLEVKPIHQKKKCGVTKEIKNKLAETVAIDDGLIRWNPAKLMPKPFAHLDNAW